MSNPVNTASLVGRLAQDVRAFKNNDGSQKLLITLAVEDNFRSGPEKKVQTNFIQLETFVPAGGSTGSWDRTHKGDLIAVQYAIDAKPYLKNGETIYPMKLVIDGFPTFLEPKSVTDKRAAERVIKDAEAAKAATPAAGTEQTAEQRIAALEAELAQRNAGATSGSTSAVAPVAQPGVDYENTPVFAG